MKSFVKNICILLIVGAIAYPYRATITERAQVLWANLENRFFPTAPCTEPISYTVGTFDTKFGISPKYFQGALADAEAVWEKPMNKNLFQYTTDDGSDVLTVNLVYDYRQQTTTKLNSLGVVVDQKRASYDELRTKFETLKTQYESAKNAFNRDVDAFNSKQAVYEAEVNSWNKKGGAPEGEYKHLEDKRRELQAESKALQARQAKLNDMANVVNATVADLNRIAATLNISAEKYNATNDARGESFEEGVYSTDGFHKEINIYEFSNREKLVRVLGHELGHALGLEHVPDAKAIMYEKNQATSLTATKADLDALKKICYN